MDAINCCFHFSSDVDGLSPRVSRLQYNSGKRRLLMSLFCLRTIGPRLHPLPFNRLRHHKVTSYHHSDNDICRFGVRFSRHYIEDSIKLKTLMRIGDLRFPSKGMLAYKHGFLCSVFFISRLRCPAHSGRELKKRPRNINWNSSSSILFL